MQKNSRKNLILKCIALGIVCSFTPHVYALTGSVYCPDDNTPLTIRNTPGGTVSTKASCGSKLNILEQNAGKTVSCDNWHKVEYNGKTGYVCGKYVKIDNSTYEKGKTLCIEDNSPLNIWSDIEKTKKLKSLSCGTEMNIIEKNVANNSKCSNWYKVESGGTTGYACGKYVGSTSSNNNASSNVNVGKSTTGDNIYQKSNYDKRYNDGVAVCYEDTGDVSLKSEAGSGTTTGKLSCGQNVKINTIKESSGKCGYYYNVTTEKNETGWACGYFINTTNLSSTAKNYYSTKESLEKYYTTLKNKGFPDSYLPYLAEIHARHPNWNFDAEKINLNFEDIVNNESYNGRSLLQGSAFNENYRSMDLNTYDILSNSFRDYATEKGWYNASSEAIAFYLDPRNYLNEKYIFAFETLNYSSYHDASTVSKILSNQSFWPSIYSKYQGNVQDDIVKATKEIGISSVHIASRIRQEISGVSTTDPRLGGNFNYNGTNYSNYYNFFNINVYGTNKILNGMIYALNHGWNTPYNGIYGGSNFIYSNYVKNNQDTMYYEKFDVSRPNINYTHQYMQNLAASIQETNTTYNSYLNLGNYISKEITFTIPVYNNMSETAVTSPRLGNPNNYLKDLKVNNLTISGFNYDKYNYEITLPAGINSININATRISDKSTVDGTGEVKITSDDQTINVIVTAENTRTRTYQIKVKRTTNNNQTPGNNENNNNGNNNNGNNNQENNNIISIPNIINKSGVKYNDNYIFGINPNTNVDSLINNIKQVNQVVSVSIKDKNGNPKSGTFKTGDIITINNSKETKEYQVLIYGDINGDGKIDKDDCLAILRQINGYTTYNGVYRKAADANKDGKVDKDDCLAILRQLNGYTNLNS